MDEADLGNKNMEESIERALINRQQPKPFTGLCSYCAEPIEKGHYCDEWCRKADELHAHRAKNKF